MSTNNYDNIILSLLDNDQFIQWVLYPTSELNLYWEKQMEGDKELKKNIKALRDTISKLKIKEPVLSQEERTEIWSKVQQRTNHSKNIWYLSKPVWLRMVSVAATATLIIGSYFFLTVNQKEQEKTDYASIVMDDEQSIRSTDVVLTLPDNKKIAVDSTNIIYDKDGVSNIQSQESKPSSNDKHNLNQLTVPYGKTISLTLSDDTRIWVNSGSRVIYPSVFKKDKREIFVLGEIYLDVAKNKDCPFIIKTNHLVIKVLGARLNVSAYGDESVQSVVLVSGAVAVKSNDLEGDYDILPSQMLSYKTAMKEVNIQKVDVNNYISWINGYLLLNSENLDNVLQKLGRHYNLSLTYDRNAFKKIYVSGKLNLNSSIESVFEYISITSPVDYTINEKHVKIELKK